MRSEFDEEWMTEVQTHCPKVNPFITCLSNTNNVGLTTSAFYIRDVANKVDSSQSNLANKMINANIGSVILWLRSPGELRVVDSSGNITGIVAGTPKEDFPNSILDPESRSTTLFFPDTNTTYEVKGTTSGTYGLVMTNLMSSTTVTAIDIPIKENASHVYSIDWQALVAGQTGVTIKIDKEGDGIFEHEIMGGVEITNDDFLLQTKTIIDFDPDSLNLKNKNGKATVYIELPDSYDVSAIDISTIKLNGAPALTKPTSIGDYDKDGVPDLMVKFERSTIIPMIVPKGEMATITVSGQLFHNGRSMIFTGKDIIRIVQK